MKRIILNKMKKGDINWFLIFVAGLVTMAIVVFIIAKNSPKIVALFDTLRGIT